MRVVLFSRVPRWYSFRNERLTSKLAGEGIEVAAVIAQNVPTVKAFSEWIHKLGLKVVLEKLKQKAFGRSKTETANERQKDSPSIFVSPKVYRVDDHNSRECVDILRSIAPDLIVLRGCGIIKKQVLDVPKVGVINPHYATLPDFRGMDVTEWSALYGKPLAVNVHTVTEGVDTGVVLAARNIPVKKGDILGDLREKCAAVAADLLTETVVSLRDGREFPRTEITEIAGHQYFQMHDRLKALANKKLETNYPHISTNE